MAKKIWKELTPVTMKVEDINPWDKNPKNHNDQAISKSIDRFGIRQAIIVQKGTNRIIVGHGRLRAFMDAGYKEVPVIEWECTDEEADAFAIADNQTTILGGWDEEMLTESLKDIRAKGMLEFTGFTDIDLSNLIDQYQPAEIKHEGENIDKDIGDIKILNLYAGIGGNRKFWGDLDITAIEYNERIAKVYQDLYPNDNMIIADAHQYLQKHFNEYDFIWSSPPCPTHSRMRKQIAVGSGAKPIYPDLKLYEEILFLDGYFKGKYCIENVISWYDPLIEPTNLNRHYFWTNFNITPIELADEIGAIDKWNVKKHQKKFGYNLDGYKFSSKYPKDKVLRNMVHPKLGEHILKCAYPKREKAKRIRRKKA